MSRFGLGFIFPGGTADGTLYTETFTTDAGSKNGLTTRLVFPVANLSLPSGAVTRVRALFHAASAEALTITGAYIGKKAASGDAYDFATTPTQLLFSGSGSPVITAGNSLWSDWMDLAWDKAEGLVVSVYCGGGTSSDGTRAKTGATINGYFKSASDAATADATGYTLQTGNHSFVSQLQSDGF